MMGEQIRVAGNSGPPFAGVIPLQEVFQHGSIGAFLGSSLEGVDSGFIRCVYTAKNHTSNTVTLLCEKMEGCCQNGCCPKDQFWMTGLIILLIFVLILLCVGTIVMIICYQRSKGQQRRVEKDIYEATSRGAGPGSAEMAQNVGTAGGVYARPVYGPAQHHYATATMPSAAAGGGGTVGHYGHNASATRRF